MNSLANEIPSFTANWFRYCLGLFRATNREIAEFSDSCMIGGQIAAKAARDNPLSIIEMLEVMQHYQSLMFKGTMGASEKLIGYVSDQVQAASSAYINTVFGGKGETLSEFMRREADVMEAVANFNEQIEKIKDEFGFHFNTRGYELVHETDSFLMYQVLPTRDDVTVRDDLKPMLLVSPYMLGVHILSFLPGEGKSYAHAFANEGIPTYVRVVKDIMTNEVVQTMTPEDDCMQTLELCTKLKEKHGRKITLNGTCQGGYICLMNLLSGKYRSVCDSLITNVAPIDGTCSDAISGMPNLHHDFVTTTLPSGNSVANGYLLSLGMRFVAIDRETPLVKVLDQASLQRSTDLNPGKTVAALFRWLLKERVHLPLAIANMSSLTFQEPIGEDGTLPVTLFDKPLKIGDLKKFGVHWHMNYALRDDLVTPPSAMAGARFLDESTFEAVPYPAGHVAILTSPYSKKSPINGRFKDKNGKEYRGPVTYQLEAA